MFYKKRIQDCETNSKQKYNSFGDLKSMKIVWIKQVWINWFCNFTFELGMLVEGFRSIPVAVN